VGFTRETHNDFKECFFFWLEMPQILEVLELTGSRRRQLRAALLAELATRRWLTERSALGKVSLIIFSPDHIKRPVKIPHNSHR